MKIRNLFPKEICEEKYREESQELDTKSSLDVEAGKEGHHKDGQDDPSQVAVERISVKKNPSCMLLMLIRKNL